MLILEFSFGFICRLVKIDVPLHSLRSKITFASEIKKESFFE